jgi:glycerol uptake facilitator-like aquaporin
MKKFKLNNKMKSKSKAFIAEFIGCFIITIVSCYMFYLQNARIKEVRETAFANAFTNLMVIFATFSFSGAHLNPAITISLLILKKIPFNVGIFYIIIQLLGSMLGGFTSLITLPSRRSGYVNGDDIPEELKNLPTEEKFQLGYCYVNPLVTESQAFLIEMMLSFAYGFLFFSMIIDK